MTAVEWLECTDSERLLAFFQEKVSERKLRLFACACERLIAGKLPADCLWAVSVAEDYADGKLGQDTMLHWDAQPLTHATARSAYKAAGCYTSASWYSSHGLSRTTIATMLRDLKNPFSPPSIAFAWLVWNDGTVRRIAQGIYDERAFDRMPILADALQDAGCGNGDILNHCRQPGVHVRGCCVLDLILGKE